MIIYSCSPPDDECIAMAKQWISTFGLSRDIIRLVKNDKYVAVIDDGWEARRDQCLEKNAT